MDNEVDKAILIVEKRQEIRRIYIDALSVIGPRIVEADNPQEAFKGLSVAKIDLILTDLHMSHGSLQYIATLRREAPNCPIIVITGFGSEESVRHAVKIAGGTLCLEQPLTTERLRNVVEHYLRIGHRSTHMK